MPSRQVKTTAFRRGSFSDALLPNTDAVSDGSISNAATETTFGVANSPSFRAGDQIRLEGDSEILFVSSVDTGNGTITVIRQYGGSSAGTVVDGKVIHILGNAALEGADSSQARFTTRSRITNSTQILSSTVEISGSELAVRQLAVADEMDYQKQQRLRELLRDLENCVINGRAPDDTVEGSATVRRTMKGILAFIATNHFIPGQGGFPSGTSLSETQLNRALREVWKNSNANIDLILVGGQEKRAINAFVGSNRRFAPQAQTYRDGISIYESDFGVCRVILSRYVPTGSVLLLDSSRIEVLPLAGRSFQFRPLARTGDRETGQLVGEYTLEFRNESAHALITGFTA